MSLLRRSCRTSFHFLLQTASRSNKNGLTSIHTSSRISPWLSSSLPQSDGSLSKRQPSPNISATTPHSFDSSSTGQLMTSFKTKDDRQKKKRNHRYPLAIIACILISALLCMAIAAILTYVLTVVLATKTVGTTVSTRDTVTTSDINSTTTNTTTSVAVSTSIVNTTTTATNTTAISTSTSTSKSRSFHEF
jgi:hypothetical protein